MHSIALLLVHICIYSEQQCLSSAKELVMKHCKYLNGGSRMCLLYERKCELERKERGSCNGYVGHKAVTKQRRANMCRDLPLRVWVMRDCKRVLISEMETSHLRSTIAPQ